MRSFTSPLLLGLAALSGAGVHGLLKPDPEVKSLPTLPNESK